MASLQPTTIYLSEELKHSLQQLVRQTGKPENELIQAAVEEYLKHQHSSLPRSVGIGASERGDLSERVDELLWQD
ncbi:MAG: ribbon-helix-helix domain-containing protein [Cyanosarcina radialis HA8281-LM2]|nr:ribbon-helix-helix domain-containing protein [Cyanosarcina radialis HA8281-LM2]